jgi:magnesium transporter
VAASAAIGLALPFLLRMIRRDPQVASGPIAMAAADLVTLLLYFNLGRWLLL